MDPKKKVCRNVGQLKDFIRDLPNNAPIESAGGDSSGYTVTWNDYVYCEIRKSGKLVLDGRDSELIDDEYWDKD